MDHDALRNSALARALADLLSDLSDLTQKEIRLAKAEVTEKISARIRSAVWMIVAGMLGLIAALLVIQAAVFAIASFDIAFHWACLLVAAVLAAAGAAAFFIGRSGKEQGFLPTRAARQITQDIRTAKEQLT